MNREPTKWHIQPFSPPMSISRTSIVQLKVSYFVEIHRHEIHLNAHEVFSCKLIAPRGEENICIRKPCFQIDVNRVFSFPLSCRKKVEIIDPMDSCWIIILVSLHEMLLE